MNYNNTVELCVHPANKLIDNKKNKTQRDFYKSDNRLSEKNLLLSDQFKDFLIDKKINLINFSNIIFP